MSEPIKASIIVSNYQGKQFLAKCLSRLSNQTYRNYEILFFDAGSTDGSAEYVEENFPNIRTIRCGRIGIGEATNLGIKIAAGDIIIFDVNTDEYVESNWLEEIIGQLKRFDFNVITGTLRIINGTNLIDEAGVNITWFGRAKKIGHRKNIDQYEIPQKAVDFTGTPAFHRKLLKKIGPVDEAYFLYGEDRDFCYRAKLRGIKTYCATRAISYHHIRGTTGKNSKKLEYFLRRAIIRFELIYASPLRLSLSLVYNCIFLPLTSLVLIIAYTKRSTQYRHKLVGRIDAIKWNLLNLQNTWHVRRTKMTIRQEPISYN